MFFQRVSGEARPKELSSFIALQWEGQGLPKNSLNVSVRDAKNPLLRTHTDSWESAEHTHAHTQQPSERPGIALLISFSVDTLFLRCAMLSQLSLSQRAAITKLEVCSFLSVSAQGWLRPGPEVRMCVLCARRTSALETAASHTVHGFKEEGGEKEKKPQKTGGLCRSSKRVSPWSSGEIL